MTTSDTPLSSHAVERVISNIYAAVAGRLPWQQPLDELAVLLGLWAAQIIGIDKHNGGLIFTEEGGPGRSSAALDYLRFFHTSNPRIAPTLATPMGDWMHCHEHFDEAYVEQSAFYQEFLIPHGGRYLSATKLIEGDDFIFLFGVLRGRGGRPIGPEDIPLLQQIKHHLTEAFRDFSYLRETFVELGMARQLLARFDYPMLVVDQACGIWHRNESAERLMKGSDVVFESAGVLAFRDDRASTALTLAIRNLGLFEGAKAATVAARRSVAVIPRRAGVPLLALVSALRPSESMQMFGSAPRVLVILHDPATAHPTFDPQIISECYDLTPAEARVSIQVAEGASAKEIASRTGVALSTIRTHIQRAMLKLGVTRQSDLIRAFVAIPALKGAPVELRE
ncbi:helix-turn-helix transcriptional regulator [Variovorax sp. GB1P17]|uniref:helix-turn-helix transcriptional regulator n=1 Tax=Variovorax sp. GB1P17 TaxID=3443740 RepID=UPI003F445B84